MLFGEIFQDQNGGWVFSPAFLKGVWNLPLRHVVCAEDKVDILIAINVPGVQCNPSPAVGFGQCMGGKLQGLVLSQINKSRVGVQFVIREIRDGGDVQVAILIEVACKGFVCAGLLEKKFLREIVFPIIQMHTHSVIRPRKVGIQFAVVPVGDEEVGMLVIIKVSHFNM